MYTNNQLTQTGRGRRTYSPEFKAKLVNYYRQLARKNETEVST
jgi:transposase-like protein